MYLKTTKLRTLALSVCIGAAVTGCGSQQTKPVSAMSATEKAQLAQAQDKASTLVSSAQKAFQTAENDQVSLYSQIYFPQAKKELAKLKEMHKEFNPNKSGLFASGYSLDELKEQANLVNQNTQKSEKTKQLITLNLKDVIDNQTYIEDLDLSKFESKYKSLQSDVKRLFKDVEKAGQFQGLENDRLKVLNDLRAFEVSVIKEKYYNNPQKELEELPESTLPVTYIEAQKRLTTLSKTIEATPRAMDTIELRQKEALKALTRAQNILKEINWIDENTSKGLEHIVLRYRKPMDRAFPDVLKEDHSELLFEDQVSKYSYLVTNLKSSLQQEVSSKDEATIKAEAQKIADMKAEELKKQLNGKHDQALQDQEKAQQDAVAKATQAAQAKFEEEKKQLAATHKQKLDQVIAERNKLQLDYEQTALQLTQLKQQHQQAQEQLKLASQGQPAHTNAQNTKPAENKQVNTEVAEAQTASAPQRNSVATAPEPAPVKAAPAPAPTKPSEDTLTFDFEIEEVEL